MCGIFGVLASRTCTKGHESFLYDAFQTGQVRGTHGTGLFTVSGDGYVRNAALAVNGTDFLNDGRAAEVLRSIDLARVVVGHNRYTTSGTNNDSHCHPFRFEHLIGVHNGSFPDYVLRHIDPADSHTVDSGRVYAALNEADDPIEVLSQIYAGAYCLVWYDGRKRSLFMARNNQRGLHLAETLDGLYFASELGMLGWLMARNGVTTAKAVPMASLDPLTLYEIPIDDPSKVTAKAYSAKAPTYQGTGSHHHPYYQGTDIYGDVVAPVAYKRYYSTSLVKQDFPTLTPLVERVEKLEQGRAGSRTVPVALLGIGTDVLGDRCAYGLLSTPDGEDQFMNITVSCKLLNHKEFEFLKGLLELGAEDPKDGQTYPIIPMNYNTIIIRPTGELVLGGMLPLSFTADEVEELLWIFNIDKTVPPWVRMCIGPECLVHLKPEQLLSAWMDLKSGKTKIAADDNHL